MDPTLCRFIIAITTFILGNRSLSNGKTESSPSFTSVMKQTNLIFIMYDDLRPELSIYGQSHMITPNFERLAAKSVVFDYAIVQIAVCNPSRDSLLTGLRPDTTGTYSFQSSWLPHLTIPTRFAGAGYNTAGYGKINHWESNEKFVWNFDSWENNW